MGRMVTVEEWAEIHGKTPATVKRKIRANAWPNAQKILLDGKLVWMLDEDWLWPCAMTPTKQAKLLCEIRRLMPPVVYTTAEDGTVICMVPCTHHTHVASGVTADEMNDLWRAAPPPSDGRRTGCPAIRLAAPSRRSEILQRERRAFT